MRVTEWGEGLAGDGAAKREADLTTVKTDPDTLTDGSVISPTRERRSGSERFPLKSGEIGGAPTTISATAHYFGVTSPPSVPIDHAGYFAVPSGHSRIGRIAAA
jgi:hypothetical protein